MFSFSVQEIGSSEMIWALQIAAPKNPEIYKIYNEYILDYKNNVIQGAIREAMREFLESQSPIPIP